MAKVLVTTPTFEVHNPFLGRPSAPEHSLSENALLALSSLAIQTESRLKEQAQARHEPPKVSQEEKQTEKIDATVNAIMDIFQKFSLQQQENEEFLGRARFSPCVRKHVIAGRKIPMVLPAFPAKSVNTEEKVLGTRPDLGEELAIDHLNDLCVQIGRVYEPGATITIATDGICYNDLVGITDEDLYEYGAALRRQALQKGYLSIEFARVMNILGLHTEKSITKERFVELLKPSREALMSRYGDPNFNVSDCIKNDPDYKMTYGGYAKFLRKDLAYGPVRETATSAKQWKARCHETAKSMITRGVAFAKMIEDKYPDHVRLSIHPSSGSNKISMPLIPQPDHFSMTPWHCAVAVDVNGNFKTAHVEDLRDDFDLIYKNGQPYFFRERSDLYSWDADVEFDHLYGGGLLVRNTSGREMSKDDLSEADRDKLVTLATLQGKIVMEGF